MTWSLGAVMAALAFSACGGSARPDHHAGHTSSVTRTTGGATDFSLLRGSLVWMRQYSPESLMWQTVSVFSTGRAELTTLIGEIAGAERRPFRISPRQVTRLRRLLAVSRAAKIPVQHDLRATLYTLHVSGRTSVILQGTIPTRMKPLVGFLTGLMSAYCC
ncbi:MAG TPA: hypothetical protein VHX62_08885 [Solirubrobacteraceae bacterium]|nr:hypothetical protein [Solirubrobacteraceae bacterium]